MDAKLVAQTFNELSSHIAASENGICSVRRELLQRARAALYDAPSDAAQAPIAWMRVTDITEWTDTEPETDGWTPLYAAPVAPAAAAQAVSDEMVSRFLGWHLPEDFAPDCGVSFKPLGHPNGWPIGTNLFTATQARAMLEHVLATQDVAPATADRTDEPPPLLPCRVCGSAAQPTQTVSGHGERWFTCVNCKEQTPRRKSQWQIVRAWNARTPNPDYTQGWQDCLSMHIAPGQPTPIYQIGAPGIAGHQVVWWDVSQEEYERQKAAGYMRTGIVYREAPCS